MVSRFRILGRDVSLCLRQTRSLMAAKGEVSSEDPDIQDGKEKFTFFFGSDSPFSNHHMTEFDVDGVTYNCTEQYMMHQKAVLFGDDANARKIMKSNNPKEQKKLGRQVSNFDDKVWNTKCKDIVKKGNYAKFSQNPDLRQALLVTKGTTMVEASPRDCRWGIGLGASNWKARDRKHWRGKNWLGEILTRVRDEIASEEELHKSKKST